MSENAMTASVTSVAQLLDLDYIEDDWTEFQNIMKVKVGTGDEQSLWSRA